MLTNIEVETLYDSLSISDESATLDTVFQNFNKHFGSDQFKAGLTLINLLDGNLLTLTQRVMSIYFLKEMYMKQQNPYLGYLVNLALKTESNYERRFLSDLLLDQKKEYFQKLLIKQIFKDSEIQLDEYTLGEDFYKFYNQIINQYTQIQGEKGIEIKSVVPEFYMTLENQNLIYPEYQIGIDQLSNLDFQIQGIQLDFMRPIPVPIDIPLEPVWLSPGFVADVCWDYQMCAENNVTITVKELINKSYTNQLNQQETNTLLEHLETDPKFAFTSGITPQLLPSIVEKNPNVASVILIKLHSSPQINLYFEKLAQMELTLSSLEVVNRLANAVELPKEFLTFYISNCIQHCEENKKDKNLQNRLVRLVCVFIKSMIKTKIINPKDMYIELQAFCIEFSRISEASSLFRLLKQLGNDNQNQQ